MKDEIIRAIVELREESAVDLVKKALEQGEDPFTVLSFCQEALAEVGELFEKKEYFLSEMIMSAQIFKQAMAVLNPVIERSKTKAEKVGTFLIGTSKGDIHELGKNIVITYMEAQGFDVHDLGVDVPPEAFLQKIKEIRPEILGMSCLLTGAYSSMKDTVEMIKKAGLRDEILIMVGGGAAHDKVAKFCGADCFVKDPVEGFRKALEYLNRAQKAEAAAPVPKTS